MASVFTRVLTGELPGHFVWKDDIAVAFMTIQPVRKGHLLVIPRAEIDHWDDLPADTAAHLMCVAQRIAQGLKALYRPQRVGLLIAGLEVPHTHIHLIPIDAMSDLSLSNARMAGAEELAEAAASIRDTLRARGCTEADF